ncbi:aminoglycoside phosphotransferase family protein [Agrobacterium rhizogenes]|uniref:aminoglycoside phosphotransferase family protein n=1 Tax=Rhizobium rhizogenes TaxID=359 RepID=UPI00115D438B|nr:aminoglycoside phosphotransferase family protein [Rhizobium rhizogenes]NTG90865.1 aminoglycoside phosphotransferase family protein [Rhizobium rhizogenes]NTI20138.1 aminoglycoside phosphotransferase family protein [Rhizobium rhizogenes]NTI39187.1 aminoglycoside phosphotransferase family protein [Rhizobium rhizogenes]TRB19852.1 aminoglycoside phosphotransferase family protein [Rhizobium rhizogenes]WEO69100.1 aminoglycoside phosphotransferase family protein [Rhizobium rhizogenes]
MDTVIIWAEAWLRAHNYRVFNGPELVGAVPWSKIYRFATSRGNIYLKWSAPAYAREAALMAHLAERFPTAILPVLAWNEAIDAFLMPDGGVPLRGKLKESYDQQLVGIILGQYARIQSVISSDVDVLLALGIDDWRVAVFPNLYDELVYDEGLLGREGLEAAEIKQLQRSGGDVRRLCRALAEFKVPETLEHCDFHDNNVLVAAEGFLIDDWGDAVITHPFFSLVGFLDSAVRNHGMDVGSPVYTALKNAYFEAWLDLESVERQEHVLEITRVLRPIEFAFNFRRVARMTTAQEFEPYRGYIGEALRRFLLKDR